jgi:hypothetical protein
VGVSVHFHDLSHCGLTWTAASDVTRAELMRRAGQERPCAAAQQAGECEFSLPVAVVVAGTPTIAECLAGQGEPAGLVTGPDMSFGIDKGFDHHDRMASPGFEVARQAGQRLCQHVGSEIGDVTIGQYALALVVGDELQPAEVLVVGAADEGVSGLAGECSGTKAGDCEPLPVASKCDMTLSPPTR